MGLACLARMPCAADPVSRLRENLPRREARFLDFARRIVFRNTRHPYHAMFQLAGCSYEDLAESVHRDGLEAALAGLHCAGVYLAHDEFKGKQPIVRSGLRIEAQPEDFLNPLVEGVMDHSSSGSRSKGTRTPLNMAFETHREAYEDLTAAEFGLEGQCRLDLKPILPSASGLLPALRTLRQGRRLEAWYAMGGGQDSLHYRMATGFMVAAVRLAGLPMPFPVYLPPNDFLPVATHLARLKREGRRCLFSAFLSPAVRVAAAAMENKLDIGGTLFRVVGEALTDSKRAVIEAAGAEVFAHYGIAEVGPIGPGFFVFFHHAASRGAVLFDQRGNG
ncbi:MAG: hypothetical protein FJW20_18225 [Acidimicrobiia bacterium]|nr:hypothetical protein [Acidimicrobiia bacterium]